MAETDELPRTIVRRVVKTKLSDLTKDASEKKEIAVHKEAIIAFSESAKVFIHYLSATANDICRECKRQTISADDVLKAVEEIDFPEFIDPLKGALEDFRRDNAIKKSEAKEKGQGKKRKPEDEPGKEADDAGNVPPEVNMSPASPDGGPKDKPDSKGHMSPARPEDDNQAPEDMQQS